MQKVAWVGSSLSKVLDKRRFEADNNVELKIVKAYTIAEETEAAYPKEKIRFPERNFKKVVPEVLDDEGVDVLILQTGSIEITNINVNQAVMDTAHDIQSYKKQWFHQVEEDSKNLFKIAEDAIEKKPDLKIVILKRLPRFDRSSQDIIGIKAKLSTFANNVYDQLLLQSNYSSNIHVTELQFGLEKSVYLKNLVYGNKSVENVDGIHLRGPGASRHFNYRAVQALKPVLSANNETKHGRAHRPTSHPSDKIRDAKSKDNGSTNSSRNYNDHTECAQAQYQHRQQDRVSYAQAVKSKQVYVYTVPTFNKHEHLNY